MKKRILSVIMGMMILGSFAAVSASADDNDFSDAVKSVETSSLDLIDENAPSVDADNVDANGDNASLKSTDESTVTTGSSTGIALAAAVLGISGAAAAASRKREKD